jgi:transposase
MNTGKMHEHDSSEAGRDVLLVAVEMSLKSWRLALAPHGAVRHRQVVVEAGNYLQVHAAVTAARERFDLPAQCAVIFCYEAGREGFHPARVLSEAGHRVWMVDSSSIEVERRQRRAKCDALDAGKLQGLMQRQVRGERVLRVVHLPSRAQEDERQRSREREELRVERARLRVRMQSLLFTQGVRDFPKSVAAIEAWMSQHAQQLPPQLAQRLERELQRLRLVAQQLNSLDQQQRQHCASPAAATTPADRAAARLCQLKGIASRSASILATEMFGWRTFHNRREVGALAGLVPTPYDSGESRHEQGISKAGNKRVRRVIVELAWQWLRHQPHSALTQWFVQRFGGQGKRSKRLGIVALARRLLVALWHYLQHDVLPPGARMKA